MKHKTAAGSLSKNTRQRRYYELPQLSASKRRYLTFQVTARIGLLKEGGKVKSCKKHCPGQDPNLVKVRNFCCFLENSKCFGV